MSRIRSPIEQRQGIDQHHAGDSLARRFGGAAEDHAARTRANHDHIAQVFVKQHLGDFGGVRLGGDASTNLMLALGTAV